MVGAHEYASMFPSGQYGKLRIYSGEHARGKYFHIYIGEKENEVEVYGILGGHPGWTEWYGWLHTGPWQSDFEKEIEKRKAALTAEFERSRQYKARTAKSELDRIVSVLSKYEESPSLAKESSAPEKAIEARLTDTYKQRDEIKPWRCTNIRCRHQSHNKCRATCTCIDRAV